MKIKCKNLILKLPIKFFENKVYKNQWKFQMKKTQPKDCRMKMLKTWKFKNKKTKKNYAWNKK